MSATSQTLEAPHVQRRRHRTGPRADHPATEAKNLADLVKRGADSAERLRDLIAISATDEHELRKILHPGLVRHHLRYRAEILKRFEALVGQGK